MEQAQINDKEIQTSYDAIRSEIVVAESDLESKEGVRRIIKKYQGRVSEMLKLIQRQRQQNQKLKNDFKHLNEQLNTVLKKMQTKPRDEDQKKTDSRLEITKKELENEVKKNNILKKELDQLKYKYKYLEGDKIDDLKNQIKEKQRVIDELNAKIRLFEKLDKQEKNGDSYKKEEQLTQKIMKQNEEIVHLKKKLQEEKKNEEQLEKTLKALREQIACFQIKLPNKLQQKPQLQKIDTISPQQHQKLRQKCKQLQNIKKMNEKSSKQEIQTLSSKLKNCERELAELKQLVSRKDKESSIMLFKLKEKERKNFNTLEPIKTARYSQEVLHTASGGLFEVRKSFRGLSWGQGVYRQFDDSRNLPIEKNYRVKRVVFTYFEQHILSLSTDYDILSGDVGKNQKRECVTIQTFTIPSQYANIKTVQYKFGDYEYIINLDLYCGKGIQYMRMTTSKEEVLEVGNPKSVPKCKLHSFQIGSHEKPISFMGVIQNRKITGENREYIVNLGLQLRRKEVFLRGRSSRRIESSLNKSMLSRNKNDKNEKIE